MSKEEISKQEFSENEALQYAIKSGIINMDSVWKHMEEMKRQEYLSMHPHKISQGKDGEWYTSIYENGRRKQKHRKTLRELEDLIISHIKEKFECPTVESVFMEWLNLKLDRGEIARPTYDRYLRDFNRCFDSIRERKIQYITELDIEDFLKRQIKEKRLSAKAFSGIRTLVYGMFRYAKKKKLINFSIKETVDDIDFARNEFEPVYHEDIEQVFFIKEEYRITSYLENNQDLVNLGILLLFKTGLRIGELSVLKKSDICGNKISISKTETFYKGPDKAYIYEIKESPKTEAGMRAVFVPDNCLWILYQIQKLSPKGEFIFMRGGERIRSYVFRDRLTSICKELNIVHKSPHKIRKTYGSKLYDSKDVSEAFMIGQMGHTDISCLQKHYYFNRMSDEEKSKMLNDAGVI